MLFDPMGFLAPYVIRAKILLQEMWTSGLDWDDPLDPSQARQAKKWFEELTELSDVQVPRCLQLNSHVETVTLHTFTDASGDAYGVVTYVRYQYKDGTVSTSLVASKTRVAPLSATKIPRLDFLLYSNDLPSSSSKLVFRLFADDTNIFYSSNDSDELQKVINEELSNVLKYCAANMLSINFKKTNYMIIATPKKKTNISITTCCIEQKSQIKYLGVFIDEHLKWDAQLQDINNKLTKNVGISFKLRHYMPINALKQLYYTLIFPYLNYGLMSWGTACQTKLRKIKVSQNNCLRCICKEKRKSCTIFYTIRNPKTRKYF